MESNNKTDFILYWYCIKLSTVKHHKTVYSTLFYQYSINVIKQSNTKKEWIHSIHMILLCFVHLSTFYILNDLLLLKQNFLSSFKNLNTVGFYIIEAFDNVFQQRALMWISLYGWETVWHKLENRQKMHFFCF